MSSSLSSFLMQTLTQLAVQLPVLLVYLVGMILALMFWRRCPGACAYALLGAGLLLFLAIGQTVVNMYLVSHQSEIGVSMSNFGALLSAIAVVCSLIRALAYALLFAAVFVGRRPPAQGAV